jgi:hypothetical protein
MKNYIRRICIILICLTISIKGQNKNLHGVWISSNNDVIEIKEEGNSFNILSTSDTDEQLSLRITKDSLNFYTKSSIVGSDKTYVSKYSFYIKKLTNSKLILIPTSKLSKDFFKNKKKIVFTKQQFNLDKSISFERLVYRTTPCYGSCSTINLELDKNKNIYIHRELFNDKINSGNFVGTISEESYNKLINILETTNLKTWSFPEKDGSDAPTTTLIIYYNGKREYFKSMFPPTISQQLIGLLYEIGEKTKLVRTDKEKQIEY